MTTRAISLVLALLLAACGSASPPVVESDAPVAETPASLEATPPEDCIHPPPNATALIDQADPVACYGSEEMTVEARAVALQGAIDCPGQLEPAWLGCGGTMVELYALAESGRVLEVVLAVRSPNAGASLLAVVHPEFQIDLSHGLDSLVKVTGHFDDPAARSCHYISWPDANPPPPNEVVEGCRSTFVVTELEPLDRASEDEDAKPTPAEAADLAADSIAQVVTTDLVVRSAPGTGDDSEILPGSLNEPTLLFVVDGPVAASGYVWYLVQPFETLRRDVQQMGWVAAGSRDGEAWIAPAEPECPQSADLASILEINPIARFACLRSTTVSVRGAFRGFSAIVPGLIAPSWIFVAGYWLEPEGSELSPTQLGLWMHYPDSPPSPALDFPVGTIIRVEGHFDDPAARECVALAPPSQGPPPTPSALDHAMAVMRCRSEFVVTDAVAE